MNILGISSYLHNTAAALVSDGTLIGAVEEERLNREKYTNAFPYGAIDWCLKQKNLSLSDIDAIAFSWNPYPELWYGIRHLIRYFPGTMNIVKQNSTDAPILPRLRKMILIQQELKKFFDSKVERWKIYRVKHHLAHASSVYYESGFDKAAILVLDGLGDNYDSVSVWQADNGNIHKLMQIKFPHSIGILYLCIQSYLGFPDNSGAGKIMGLSSYGTPVYVKEFEDLVQLEANGRFRLDLSLLQYHLYGNNKTVSSEFIKRFGLPRGYHDPLEQKHADMAYALQKLTEKIILHICQYVRQHTGNDNLCIAGGVGLNCVANGAIAKQNLFKRIHVAFAPHDGGGAIGAAEYISHGIYGIPVRADSPNLGKAYTGPQYSNDQIYRTLVQNQMGESYRFIKIDEPSRIAAENIAAGKIIAWFQGEMEFGPRALGNRSILADPRNSEMKDMLNRRVKFREGFRPFAPSVLEEYSSEYFTPCLKSPYMSFVCNVLPNKRHIVPAITHVDGTARVQTVNKLQNPLYYRLISEFYELTGIPMVLNTSFNIKGMPICCSPDDALQCFLKCDIDSLIIGNYLVTK